MRGVLWRRVGVGFGVSAWLGERGYGWVVATDGAMCGAAYVHLEVGEGEAVEAEELVGEERADASDVLYGLEGLEGAYIARYGAEDTDLGGGVVGAWGGFVAVEASEAGVSGCVGEGLAFVGEYAAVGEGFMCEDAGVVDEVFGVHVVGGVDDEVVGGDGGEGVGGGQGVLVGGDVDIGVEGCELLERALDFGAADVGCGVEDLSLEVGDVDGVIVHDADMAYACGCEVVCHG